MGPQELTQFLAKILLNFKNQPNGCFLPSIHWNSLEKLLVRFNSTIRNVFYNQCTDEDMKQEIDFSSWNPNKQIVATSIFAILQLSEDLSLESDFFEVGGDSITAILLARKCSEKGLQVDTKTIFQCRTIGLIARASTIRNINPEILEIKPIIVRYIASLI